MKFGLYSSSWWMTSLSTSHRNTDASARLSTQRRLERWQMTQRQWCCWRCNLHKNILWDLVTSDNASVKSTNASTRSRTSCKTWRRGHRPLSWYHTEWVKSLTKYKSFKHESSKQRTQLVRRRPKPSPCEEWHSHPERRWLDLKPRSRRVDAELPQVVDSTRKSMHQRLGPVPPQGMIQIANASRRRLLRRSPMRPRPKTTTDPNFEVPFANAGSNVDLTHILKPVGSVQNLFNGIFSNTESNWRDAIPIPNSESRLNLTEIKYRSE